MAHTPRKSARTAAGSGTPQLECPLCHWRAEAPPNWAAPFAICPRCETRIPNPDPAAHARGATQTQGRRGKPRKMPAGYTFNYTEADRQRGDARVRSVTIVALGLIAIMGTFWAIDKRAAQMGKPQASEPGERVDSGERAPSASHLASPEGAPRRVPLPNSLIDGFDSPDLTEGSGVLDGENAGLWDAPSEVAEPLAPPASSGSWDPSLPNLGGGFN